VELRSEVFKGELLHPGEGFAPASLRLEIRWDPLTGQTARLIESPDTLFPPNTYDLAALAEQTRANCPFCPHAIEAATPKLPAWSGRTTGRTGTGMGGSTVARRCCSRTCVPTPSTARSPSTGPTCTS